MTKTKALIIALAALCLLALTSATASADRISPGGAITADFPRIGDIRLTTGVGSSNCPLRLIGVINTTKSTDPRTGLVTIGRIDSANPNPVRQDPNCAPASAVSLLGFPWTIAASSLQAGGGINIVVLGVTAQIDAIPCTLRGNVTALINAESGGTSLITNLAGALTGTTSICAGGANVSGNGGILTPGQRLIV